jgi:hypothetical protein
MAGNPDQANIWADANVYVAFDLDATDPADADTPFGGDWDLVGLLDGEEGFTEARDEDTEDHYAWGGVLIRTSRRNFKLTRSFTALETNEVTDRLRWPGSSATQILVPSGNRIERVKVAFEMEDGDEIRRLISAYQAEITVDGDVNENEQDIASVPFMVTVFPDDDGVLFNRQDNTLVAS